MHTGVVVLGGHQGGGRGHAVQVEGGVTTADGGCGGGAGTWPVWLRVRDMAQMELERWGVCKWPPGAVGGPRSPAKEGLVQVGPGWRAPQLTAQRVRAEAQRRVTTQMRGGLSEEFEAPAARGHSDWAQQGALWAGSPNLW